MTKTYNLETEDKLWQDWKKTVPRTYPRLNDRIEELLAADKLCQEKHGKGAIELLAENDLLDQQEIDQLTD